MPLPCETWKTALPLHAQHETSHLVRRRAHSIRVRHRNTCNVTDSNACVINKPVYSRNVLVDMTVVFLRSFGTRIYSVVFLTFLALHVLICAGHRAAQEPCCYNSQFAIS